MSGGWQNSDARGLTTSKAEPAIATTNLDRVAKRRERQDLDLFAFEQAQFKQALYECGLAGDVLDGGVLAGAELVERGQRAGLRRKSINGPDKNAGGVVAAKAEPTARELQQAWASGAHNLKLAAVADAYLRHSPNPVRLTLNIFHDGASAGVEKIERKKIGPHGERLVNSLIPY